MPAALIRAGGDAAFKPVHHTLQSFIDAQVLPGASFAVLMDDEVVHSACMGFADRERGTALREDHLFRVFSNTKLVTACAALLLMQDGRLRLDDPVALYLPALQSLRVLRADARSLANTQAAQGLVTLRHLFTHTAGFTYARTRAGSLLGDAYEQRHILLDEQQTLADMVQALAELPLLFQPGSRWEYSVCTDVLARVVEVVSGQSLEAFFRQRIFEPLGMRDTGFHVPPGQRGRLTRLYRSPWPQTPWRGGLVPADDLVCEKAFTARRPLQSGGGGLLSTLADMSLLVRSLVSPRRCLLDARSLHLLCTSQLPPGVDLAFPTVGTVAGKGFGFGGAITHKPGFMDPPAAVGEVQWGGIAGTHWWISPARRTAAVIMTQRYMGFWHLFAFRARRDIYAALG